MKKSVIILSALIALFLCSCSKNKTEIDANRQEVSESTNMQKETDSIASEKKITAEMAYEGVSNYCHSEYDWSPAEDNSSVMYVTMGEETESEYQVIFRSYTGAFVYFYVEKTTGSTRMVEYSPAVDVEEEAGTINLFDYLNG